MGVLGSITDRVLAFPSGLVIALVFLLPALEASAFVGFIFPGEIAVILGGVVASQGRIPLWAVIAASVSGAIIGDSIGYVVGRRWGVDLLRSTLGRLPLIRTELDKHLESARDYVRRRRGRAVFFGRFTAALRVLVPGLAGMAEVHYPLFLAYNVAGGVLWGTGYAVLGYAAGASYRRVEEVASRVGLVLLAVVVVGLLAARLMRQIAAGSPGWKALGERLAAFGPVAWVRRRYPDQVVWVGRRLDPRDPRGFWLTFTIAVGVLCAWAFGALTQDVVGHDEVALVDPQVEAWVIVHRTDWLTGVMEAVTWLGSIAVVIPIGIVVCGFFVIRRRDLRPAGFLIAALAGAIGLYEIVKNVVDRPRPSTTIWIGHYSGGAFPSGHATQSVAFYGMLAVVLGIGSSARPRAILWSAAGLIAIVVGASRIYLGGHWLSDVLGGYALGAAWVATVAVIMVLSSRWATGRSELDDMAQRP